MITDFGLRLTTQTPLIDRLAGHKHLDALAAACCLRCAYQQAGLIVEEGSDDKARTGSSSTTAPVLTSGDLPSGREQSE